LVINNQLVYKTKPHTKPRKASGAHLCICSVFSKSVILLVGMPTLGSTKLVLLCHLSQSEPSATHPFHSWRNINIEQDSSPTR